jgi:hypothetical protein
LLGCSEWWAAEEVHQDVSGVRFELYLLDEQTGEMPPLLSGPCSKDLSEDLTALLYESQVDWLSVCIAWKRPVSTGRFVCTRR